MDRQKQLEPTIKLWLQVEGKAIGGEGRIELLQSIEEEGSLNKAAKKLNMSYRHAWGIVKKLEERLDLKLVKSEKGGTGGGGSKLTDQGRALVEKYHWMNDTLNNVIKKKMFWENMSTKLSARNNLKGKIEDVDLGEVGAKIKLKIEPSEMTAFITKEAAEDLDLKEGDDVEAVVKATEVMISKP